MNAPNTTTQLEQRLVDLQTNNGSLVEQVQVSNQLARELFFNDIRRSIEVMDRAYALVDKVPEPERTKAQLDCLLTLARAHYQAGHREHVVFYAFRGLSLLDDAAPNNDYLFHFLNLIGLVHMHSGLFDKSFEYFSRALRLAESAHDFEKQAIALGNISVWYSNLNLYDKSIEASQNALRLNDNRSLSTWNKVTIYNNLAHACHKMGAMGEALTYAHSALALARESYLKSNQATVLITLAEIYIARGDYEQAEAMLHEAHGMAKESGAYQRELETMLNLGEIAWRKGDLKKAATLFEKALSIAEVDKQGQRECVTKLAAVSEEQGNYIKAAHYYKLCNDLSQAVYNEQMNQRISLLEVIHRTEMAKREAELARQEVEIYQLENAALERMMQKRTRELEGAQIEVLERLAVAGEKRHDETGEHNRRVGDLSGEIANLLSFTPDQVEIIRLAARLHDIGKIAIPDHILLKPGRLTPDEYAIMQQHTVIGAQILAHSDSPFMQTAEHIALNHHERWDGRGYPNGLSGEAIPLVGRIVAVVDLFDALVHERLYKQAWPIEMAIEEIRRVSGTQFDPKVVDAFLRALEINPEFTRK